MDAVGPCDSIRTKNCTIRSNNGFLRQGFESLPATLAMAGVMFINVEAPHLGSSHSQTTITQGA